MAKIRRNEKCQCGSGRKYKRCCGAVTSAIIPPVAPRLSFEELPSGVRDVFLRQQMKDAERINKYGHVGPPIAVDHQGYKFVAAGHRVHYSKQWKTFHDFLITYTANVLGGEWGNAEIAKPFLERHPIMQWYQLLCDFQKAHDDQPHRIKSAVMSGPVMAYLAVAYDLYTLDRHALLQEKLIRRMKVKDQFQGARYETYVAAAFVRAGFDVVLEDESDSSTSHCEFTARHTRTGFKYSVEAKSRHRPGLLGQRGDAKPLGEINANVYKLLQDALKKRAEHERIVFVDLNVPPQEGVPPEAGWPKEIVEQVDRLEDTQSPENPWPRAFVFFTNHPYHYVGNDQPEPGRSTALTGINIPEFKKGSADLVARTYPVVSELLYSIVHHTKIPHEFE